MSIYKFDELKVKDLKTLYELGFEAILDGDMKAVIVRKPFCEFCDCAVDKLYKDGICEKCWTAEKMVGEDLI